MSGERSASGLGYVPPINALEAVEAVDLENPDSVIAPADPDAKLSKRYIAAFLIASLTLYAAFIAPFAFSLAIRLEQINPLAKNDALALAIGIPGFAVMVTGPLVGVLSDRTKSRLGRRRPWFLGGSLCGFFCCLLVGLAHTVPMAIGAWTAAFICYSTAAGMLTTHLGDRLPASQRGRVTGFTGSVTQIGPVLGIVIAGKFSSTPFLMLGAPAAVALLGGLFFAFVMKDPHSDHEPGPVDIKTILDGFWFNPCTHRNFAWVLASRALVFLALSFTSVYTVYLLAQRLHLAAGSLSKFVATAGLLGLPVAILGAMASGWLSDRFKARKPFLLVSALLLAVGSVVTALLTNVPEYYVGVLVGVLGIGAYGATDQAMILDVLPQEEGQNGRYLALSALANQFPQAAGPFVAGMIIRFAGGNYTWAYFAAAFAALVGGLLILPVRYVWREADSHTDMNVTGTH